jgi:shikimate kinase
MFYGISRVFLLKQEKQSATQAQYLNWVPTPVNETSKSSDNISTIVSQLNGRSIVLIGLMGAGKTTIGRRLAKKLKLPFADADTEIEKAAGKTVPEIFEEHGEQYFRDGERRVIERLLNEQASVLATGGGAYMNQETRETIAGKGVSVWLKADFELLMKRVRKRSNRPLLKTDNPEAVMRKLITERYPVYANSSVMVESRDVPHDQIVAACIETLADHLHREETAGA